MFIAIVLLILILFGAWLYKSGTSRNSKLLQESGLFLGGIYALIISAFSLLVGSLFLPNSIPLESFELQGTIDFYTTNPFIIALMEPINLFLGMNLIDFSIALLGLVFWVMFLNKLIPLKIGAPVQFLYIFLGSLLPFIVVPLATFLRNLMSFEMQESWFWMFLHWITEYGLTAEGFKLLILAPILFSKKKSEPAKLILLASLVAIGFSFTEGIYRPKGETGTLVGWSITLTFMHIAQSCIAIYGFILYQNDSDRRSYGYVILYLVISALFTGIVTSAYASYLSFIVPVLFFPMVLSWAIIVGNSCSNSRKFVAYFKSRKDETNKILLLFVSIAIASNYIISTLTLKSTMEYEFGWIGVFWLAAIFSFFLGTITDLDIFPGYWRHVIFSFESEEGEIGNYAYGFLLHNISIAQNLVGRNVHVHCPSSNHYLAKFFDIDKGKIVKRIVINYNDNNPDPDWYILRLKNPMAINEDFNPNYLAIQLVNSFASLEHDTHVKCRLKLIYSETSLKSKEFSDSQFYSYGRIIINGPDYVYENNG